jgi:hypothetical protein
MPEKIGFYGMVRWLLAALARPPLEAATSLISTNVPTPQLHTGLAQSGVCRNHAF